jgi:alkyl hydroperoxide reductase subunit F
MRENTMLDTKLRGELQAYLKFLRQPIEIIASTDESEEAVQMFELLRAIGELSERVSIRAGGGAQRRPSFAIGRPGDTPRVHFAGIPLGHEFTSLVLAMLHVGGHPPKVDESLLERVRSIVPRKSGVHRFEVFVSLSCHNCPDVVQALNTMAALNPAIEAVMVDGALFQNEVEARGVMAVPSVYLDGKPFGQGRMSLEDILQKLDTGGAAREAEQLDARPPYDVLVVGGGPAGAAAAIYAARKGIRTGIVTERFGGQVLDTLGIENYISVPHTDGPHFVAAMEQHVKAYDVDILASQRAEALAAAGPDGYARVRLANGATL